jgi:hypothetical protein
MSLVSASMDGAIGPHDAAKSIRAAQNGAPASIVSMAQRGFMTRSLQASVLLVTIALLARLARLRLMS